MALIALFFAAVYYGRVMNDAYLGSGQWNEVVATIVSSELVPSACGKGGDKFAVRVHYRYALRGTVYAGDRIWFGESFCGAWSEARDVGGQWTAGAQVKAWVDPVHPDRAVLVRGAVAPQTWGTVVLFCFWLGVLVVTGLWVWLRKPPQREPPRPKPGGGF